jgi:cbb3-type cytochrome oxidase subunit 3
VAGIIIVLVIFYIIAIYYAFQAYKEFKGIAEDTAGGPENLNEGANIMAYGTLQPR